MSRSSYWVSVVSSDYYPVPNAFLSNEKPILVDVVAIHASLPLAYWPVRMDKQWKFLFYVKNLSTNNKIVMNKQKPSEKRKNSTKIINVYQNTVPDPLSNDLTVQHKRWLNEYRHDMSTPQRLYTPFQCWSHQNHAILPNIPFYHFQ